MAKYLIIRLSAMGDVAMLLPALYAVSRANPQHGFTLLTQPFLTSLLVNPPANLEAMAIDIRREERSVWGLLRYAERLRKERFDYLIDLHSVLRTWLLGLASCVWSPTRWYRLRKPRAARRRLLYANPRELRAVPPMLNLYVQTLRRSGLDLPADIPPISLGEMSTFHQEVLDPYFASEASEILRLGIAPFASVEAKTYDLVQMQELVGQLSASGRYRIYLFGGRSEAKELEIWAARYGAISLAGRLGLHDELYAMSLLDLMLSMDSANAHLASMVGIPVLSIWCATHPAAGFIPLGQSQESCLQPDEMPCRPCSIFGKVGHCALGDMPCRRALLPNVIAERIDALSASLRR